MATSRAPAIVDALVALCRAAPALTGVTVMDGPQPTGDPLKAVVTIGWDADEDDDQAVETTQQWAGLGARSRDETVQVTCAALAWHGETTVRPVRDRAYALVAAVEGALRDDPTIGLPPPTVAALATGNAYQRQTGSGAQCRIVFVVAVQTRI